MENTVPRKQRLLPEFSVNISSTIISGEMTRRTETEHKKGRERLVDQSERTMGRTKGIKEQKDPIKGGPLPRCGALMNQLPVELRTVSHISVLR